MPRQARQKSSTGIYHIMLRGINKQVIFEDDEDRKKFIETLKTYKAISGYKIFAYCLMSNHAHILLKVGQEDIDLIVRRIAGSYVYWFNWKHYRRGHLFQERYKSEPVENDGYLKTVLRYIHQNPVKAGLCSKAENYEFSSYNEFIKSNADLIDLAFVLSIISKEDFIKFHKEYSVDQCLDIEEKEYRLSDADAKAMIVKISKCKSVAEFQLLERQQRDSYIKKLRKKGLSIRQISRVAGISFAIVRKIT